MGLFDKIVRDYLGPARDLESHFSFLNRSARTEFQRVRDILEQWFNNFPASGKNDLQGRFRSDDNRQHLRAFFELYCYALICHQGFAIELHPSADPEKTTHPEFLVRRGGEPAFYLECTLAAESDVDCAAQARLNQVYEALNRLKSPNFWVGVLIKNAPQHSPSASRMRSFLEKQFQELDPDEMSEIMTTQDLSALPRWTWNDSGWEIVFFPIPKSPEARNKPGVRPIGVISYEPRWVDSQRSLLNALKSKTSRYGNLDYPYIIAVNALDIFVDEIDIADALFGKEHFHVNIQTGKFEASRSPDGLWVGPQGPRNRRISAVLIVSQLVPWAIAARTPVLWHNPWANKELEPDLWQGPQMVLDLRTSTMERRDGSKAWEILRLPPDWPIFEERQ